MIEAQIVLDSIAPSGNRLTTFQLRYPRFIHSELMTHRQFSRNASSSRAIPFKRLVQDVLDAPAMPLVYLKNKRGMQGGIELNRGDLDREWLRARDEAVRQARKLADAKVHKQIVNRLLEPFSHITVLVSSTTYDNFFALRYHSDAQPEIYELAKQMHGLYLSSEPQQLDVGQWHIPYVTANEVKEIGIENALKCSVARCARVSYLTHDKKQPLLEDDLKLYSRLIESTPMHASPAEHQGKAWSAPQQCGNFTGFMQYRKTLPNECTTQFSLSE